MSEQKKYTKKQIIEVCSQVADFLSSKDHRDWFDRLLVDYHRLEISAKEHKEDLNTFVTRMIKEGIDQNLSGIIAVFVKILQNSKEIYEKVFFSGEYVEDIVEKLFAISYDFEQKSFGFANLLVDEVKPENGNREVIKKTSAKPPKDEDYVAPPPAGDDKGDDIKPPTDKTDVPKLEDADDSEIQSKGV